MKKIGYLLIGVFAGILLIQPAACWTANYYLSHNAHLPVRVARLFVNPATSRVSLGFEGVHPGQMLLLDLGRVRFDWWTLFLKRLRVGQVLVQNASFSVVRDARGRLFVGSIELPAQAPPPSSPAPAASKPEEHGWGIGLGRVEISSVTVAYHDPAVKVQLVIRHFTLEPVESWHPQRASRFEADLLLQDTPLRLTGTLKPFARQMESRGRIDLAPLALDWLTPVLSAAGVSRLSGSISAGVSYHAVLDSVSQEVQLESTGRVMAAGISLRGAALGTMQAGFTGDIGWNGVQIETSSAAVTSIRFERVEIGPAARFLVSDSSYHPAFHYALAPLALRAGPGRLMDRHPRIPFSLITRSPSGGSIRLEGAVTPLAAPPEGALRLAIERLNLTPFSPYAERATAYRIASGQLTMDSEGAVDRGQLASKTRLDAQGFYLNKLRAEERDETMESIGLPLGLGLALLRDADDHIRLEVPVDGELTDPKVPVGRLVWAFVKKALSAAVRNAAMAFFPGGGQISFQPIVFAPNSAVLTPQAQAYLTEVGKNMSQRPQVALTLTGKVTPQDYFTMARKKPEASQTTLTWESVKPEVRRRLQALGAARAQAVQDYLS